MFLMIADFLCSMEGIRVNGLLVYIVQVANYCCIGLPLRWWLRIRRLGWCGPKEMNRSYVLASNHPSRFDPFVVTYSFKIGTALSVFPIRFVTAEKYLEKWLWKVLLIPLGSVSIRPRSGKKVTSILSTMLDVGQTVYIVPGGGLEKQGHIVDPKVGVVYLERRVQKAMIIPVKVMWSGDLHWKSVLFRRISVDVYFGNPFRHESFEKDLVPLARDVLKRIESL